MTPKRLPRRGLAGSAWCVLALAMLAGCRPATPPEKERPPEPQATHTQLRDAIQAPVERARAVEADTLQAAARHREAIEAATGG